LFLHSLLRKFINLGNEFKTTFRDAVMAHSGKDFNGYFDICADGVNLSFDIGAVSPPITEIVAVEGGFM